MTEEEQQDLLTPGLEAWCAHRWIALQQSVYVDGLMEHNLRRHDAVRYPKGSRRRTDFRGAIKRFDSKGQPVAA